MVRSQHLIGSQIMQVVVSALKREDWGRVTEGEVTQVAEIMPRHLQ